MSEPKIKLELYLVRHGESMSNIGMVDGLVEDLKADPPLSELGVRQAKLLGERFSNLKFDHILSSGLHRALRTAYEVSVRQPDDGAKQVEVHKIFTECGTGEDCKGRTIDEIREELPIMISAVGMEKDERIVFHGKDDTDAQLLERGKQAISYLLERFHNGERVMVAAHAAFNTFMMYAALGLDHNQKFDPSFDNTGVTKIVFYEEGTGKYADIDLVYHNDISHVLKEIPDFRY